MPAIWKTVALRVSITILAALTILLIGVAAPPASWSAAALTVLWLTRVTVWFACVLALAIVILLPKHPASVSLAVLLTFASMACAIGVAATVRFPMFSGLPQSAALATSVVSLLIAAAALARASVTFPRVVTRDDFVDRVHAWRPTGQTRRRASRSLRAYQKFDNRVISLILLCMPRARRSSARRTFLQHRRQNLKGGKPQLPTSWVGLPWSGWKIGAVAASITVALFAIAPREVAMLFAAITGVILAIHAVVYFALGFNVGDADSRRQTMWVVTGFLTAILIIASVGTFQFLTSILIAIAMPLGWPLYRDNYIIALIQGPLYTASLALAALAMVCGLAVAIFRHGALDPKLVIRSTAIYGAVGIILAGVFILIENLASSFVQAHISLPHSMGSWLAGASVALAFGPVRLRVMNRTTGLIDRLIPATALAEGMRRSAAILFTDLVGYSALTAANEDAALTFASLLHKQARNTARQFGGRLVKTVGDAVLLEFPTAVSGFRAAEKLHFDFSTGCDLLGLDHASLQSGLHYGDIVTGRDGDVFGDTVNVAARLQHLAGADFLVLSETAANELSDGMRPRLESIGEQHLRNITQPVQCFRQSFSQVHA